MRSSGSCGEHHETSAGSAIFSAGLESGVPGSFNKVNLAHMFLFYEFDFVFFFF